MLAYAFVKRSTLMLLQDREQPQAPTCPFCKGTGQCCKCSGSGVHIIHKGILHLKHEIPCMACEGSGECQLCHGKEFGDHNVTEQK